MLSGKPLNHQARKPENQLIKVISKQCCQVSHYGQRSPYLDSIKGVCLIPAFAELAATGATIVIAFDQDAQKRKRRGVAGSLARLAERLIQEGCDVRVAVWHHRGGKGIDDVLVAKGADFVHDAIASALPFEQWKASLPETWFKASRPAGYALELKRIEALHAKLNA